MANRAAESLAAIRISAPAKINLYLHVTGRRADGFHLLDSLVAFAGVGDTVSVRPASGLDLTIDGPLAGRIPKDEQNLVFTAARRLAKATKTARGAAIRLTKRLPVAAGLGGGSADAAAALRALADLWGVADDMAVLGAVAETLGADVPVCLARRAAFVGGIGERITLAPALPQAWLVLANPGSALSTPKVFAARTGRFAKAARFTDAPAAAGELAAVLARRANGLTRAAVSLAPAVGETLAALAAEPAALLTRMSGSGATCFALFAEAAAAAAAAARLAAAHPDWWVRAAPLLARMPGDAVDQSSSA
jgi:4-diphosphocytidyl-2-C-methyl-D-erythritol kinase